MQDNVFPVTKKRCSREISGSCVCGVICKAGDQQEDSFNQTSFPSDCEWYIWLFTPWWHVCLSFMKNRLINVMKRVSSSKSTAEVASERYFADLISDSFLN